MVKFTVLKYNEFILTQFGIFSKQSSNQTYSNVFFKALSSYYILLTMAAFVVSSSIFVYQNSEQFDVALRVFTVSIGTAQSIGMFFSFGKNIKKVNTLHHKLQEIVDESTKGEYLFFKMRAVN